MKVTFTEVYEELGTFFESKIDKDTPLLLAQSIAESLEEQFQEFQLGLKVEPRDDGVALSMSLHPDYLLPLLQEIRRIKMEVTSLQNSWGSP